MRSNFARLFTGLIALMLTLCPGLVWAQESDANVEIEAVVQELIVEHKVPGLAVCVVKGGQIYYQKSFGFRDVGNQLPVTEDTIFPIASATKSFTSFIVAKLVEQGKLDLDKPVKDYLPAFELSDQYLSGIITTRDLLSHQTGIPGNDLVWYKADSETRDLLKKIPYLPVSNAFRREFSYNNMLYALSGMVVEAAVGKSWSRLVQDILFDPLAMKRSSTDEVYRKEGEDYALPYFFEGEENRQLDWLDLKSIAAAGAINTTSNDIAQWLQLLAAKGAFEGKQLLQKPYFEQMYKPEVFLDGQTSEGENEFVAYGLGWFMQMYQGKLLVFHGGNIRGFTSMISFMPEEGIAVAVMVNTSNSLLPDILSTFMYEHMLGLEKRSLKTDALKRLAQLKQASEALSTATESVEKLPHTHALEDYVGEYEHQAYGKIKVVLDDGQLFGELREKKTPLEHKTLDIFTLRNSVVADMYLASSGDLDVLFSYDFEGKISQLTTQIGQDSGALVFAKKPDTGLDFSRYLGSFNDGNNIISIVESENVLFAVVGGRQKLELVQESETLFRIKLQPVMKVEFSFGPDGTADVVTLITPGGKYPAKRQEN